MDGEAPRFAGEGGGARALELERAELRVVTFNIEHAREVDGAIRLFHGTSPLRDPDLLMLQEMDEDGVGVRQDIRLWVTAVRPKVAGHESIWDGRCRWRSWLRYPG